ncbi:MAG: SfiI family type II restriction endonuclease [Methylococcales bacterium]
MDQFLRDPYSLSGDEIEEIEMQSLRALFVGACNLGFDAFEIFRQSSDNPKDIGEDTTREMMDRLGGYQLQQRILGNVDYRKAHYVILPELSLRQALFVDSKAEKGGATSGTLQMSQLSMRVRFMKNHLATDEPGHLQPVSSHGGKPFLTTTLLAHYTYEEAESGFLLKKTTLVAVPNGKLQDTYNPDAHDTIWIAGRDAPTRGEDFRVRISFRRLILKRSWRVQEVSYIPNDGTFSAKWGN